jgi:hypothetical protein
MDFVIPELKNAFGWPDEQAVDAAGIVKCEIDKAKVFKGDF